MRQQFLTLLALSLSVGWGLSACNQNSANLESNKLTLTGSSTVAPLASEIAKKFEAEHPGVRIDVQTGGSSRGLADATQGLADIGMISRALKDSETEQFQSYAIAQDGIGIILESSNPVQSLSNQQVVDIYQGKINNWQEVGGEDAPITVVNKAEGRSTLELFLKYFQLTNSQIQADVIIGDNQQGIKTVSGNQNAIGYVSIGAAERDISAGVPLKLLSVGGVEASTETLQDGSFPLSRPLTLVTKETPSGLTKEFIEFAQSENVHDLVEAQNFVPISPQKLVQVP
ncbi:putative phosphate ABC transporter, phosphate-binding protein [Hyella patelloides LEGE 07179]|uniref:Putative phosphate ABC transporter, phosphate-binding protein n=1 Tax=Hyella patelloides LEGE 07179 TaxID=945734 RepID=A0A563W564_9CYAN|nr:phosphate ABC transporter substrate-binding protein [Hyella patelloides]VEP18849.1 putative phosphate ABC transporter, phosphate-binding protein [Hyella patelloides LEGE 07179]